jgi:hypothetical protein
LRNSPHAARIAIPRSSHALVITPLW